MPPDVAARIVHALDLSPATVVTLVDRDFTIAWVSRSAAWITGSDPDSRQGASSLERIHPDDVDRLVDGMAQLQAVSAHDNYLAGVAQPIRYRFERFDGRWVVMEATIHNLLGVPEVDGLLVFSRPVSGELDGVGYVIDLLAAGMPLPDVLGACASLVPEPLGAAAVVALLPEGAVAGTPEGSPATDLIADDRWWRPAADGSVITSTGFDGFPPDAADRARAQGFRAAWAMPIREPETADVVGCVVLWLRIPVEPNMATDEALRHTTRLASLVIGERRRTHDLRRRAVTDPLTGLANRSGLDLRLDEASGPVTVAIVDLDDFKPVNDTHGHDTGDAVLRVVAERLRHGVRERDLAVRFGGDEFAVVFAEDTRPADAARTAERLVGAIEQPIALDGGVTVTVGASVGVATAAPCEVTRLADAALYEAKRAKRANRA